MSETSLGKRKTLENKYDSNNLNPLKKQKICNIQSNKTISSYTSSSILCNDFPKNYSTICISKDQNIYCFGLLESLSFGFKENIINPPKQITSLTDIKMISCGYDHSILLNFSGSIFSIGNNDKGQLGIGIDNNLLKSLNIPQQLDIPPIKQISCSNKFSLCVSYDEILYSFGDNSYGQLGISNKNLIGNHSNIPIKIPDLSNIDFVECGGFHVICKTFNNTYYSWGDNVCGQLGQGHNSFLCNKPIQCLNWPDNIINIKCGSDHTLVLTSNGDVYSFGDNNKGQLGINNFQIEDENFPCKINDLPEIKRIECGYNHSICIDIDLNLWLFGDNNFGQLGLGDTINRIVPKKHESITNVIDISHGGNHTFIKTIDNEIYAFGDNEYSQLGEKTISKQIIVPMRILNSKDNKNEDIWGSFIGKSKQKSARK